MTSLHSVSQRAVATGHPHCIKQLYKPDADTSEYGCLLVLVPKTMQEMVVTSVNH